MRRLNGTMPLDRYQIAAGATLLAGEITALNAAGKAVRATDAAALTVIGLSKQVLDGYVEVEDGIYALANSADHPVTRAMRGQLCFVEDQNTVASSSANSIAAGVVVDVYDSEVYVIVSPVATKLGRMAGEFAAVFAAIGHDHDDDYLAKPVPAAAVEDVAAAGENSANLIAAVNGTYAILRANGFITPNA